LDSRAKYQSYDALRQKFWWQYLKQYDTDDNGSISRLEITSMLDSLGSTLSGETVDAFFSSRGKDTQTDELSISEVVQSLEVELFRPAKDRKRVDASDYNGAMDPSAPATPALGGLGAGGEPFGQLDFAGPPGHIPNQDVQAARENDPLGRPDPPPAYATESNQQNLAETLSAGPTTLTAPSSTNAPIRYASPSRIPSYSSDGDVEESSGSSSPMHAPVERVINVKTCPLCHRPRLRSKAEVDIVTHLAICASQDWARVDKIVVGNFVTSSQAQRKWMAKLIGKISTGAYKLGAVRKHSLAPGCALIRPRTQRTS
jgi:phosphatidylserine decarboxylase